MEIKVNMKLNEDYMNGVPGNSLIASGWVELEGFLKFPVKLRSRKDNSGMFVSYPRIESGNSYMDIVYPHDKKVRKEIEEHVMNAFYKEIGKGEEPEIEGVRVTIMKDKGKNEPVILRGIATLKIAGMTIKGILIKESVKKGLFVEMPQHRSGGEYKDTVYATNKQAQWWIRHEVEYAYKTELEKMMGHASPTLQENKQEGQFQTEKEEPQEIMPDDWQVPIRQEESQMQTFAGQQTQETGREAEEQPEPEPEMEKQPEQQKESIIKKKQKSEQVKEHLPKLKI